MRAKRKSCKERQLVDLINKRFKVFCNESYDLDGAGCMNCRFWRWRKLRNTIYKNVTRKGWIDEYRRN